MDGGAWWATVHGVTKSQTWLSNFTSLQDEVNVFCIQEEYELGEGKSIESYGLSCVLHPNPYIEAPVINRSQFEGKAFNEVIKAKWGHRNEALI